MFCSLFINVCVSALFSHIAVDTIIHEYYFDYHAIGPHLWSTLFPGCGGKRQSPIALESATAVKGSAYSIKWYNWKNTPRRIKLQNSGQTVMMVPKWDNRDAIPYVKLTNKSIRTYMFSQIHFHWGAKDDEGSEHTLDGKRFPLEIHAVLYRKDFRNYGVARQSPDPDALIVLTRLWQIGNKNDYFERMVESHLYGVKTWGMWTYVAPESFQGILPSFTKGFFIYDGSITTPPCNENLIFIVSTDLLSVASSQLKTLRRLEANTGQKLTNNFRPVQELNGRKVYLIE